MNASGSKSSGARVKGVIPIHDQGVVEVTSVSRGVSQIVRPLGSRSSMRTPRCMATAVPLRDQGGTCATRPNG